MNFFDLHADTPYKCYKEKLGMYNSDIAVRFNDAVLFDKWHQIFAIWIKEGTENPFGLYNEIMANFKRITRNRPRNLTILMSVEGGAVIERDICRVKKLFDDGIRILTLTWNGENAIAGGCKSAAGLTRFGRNVIFRMNELGMVCDVSHLNDKSFYKVVDVANRVIATHSNCRFVFDNKRNLTDRQLKLIAEKGGIVGLNFFSAFLGGDTFEKIYENIYHLLEIGLENHIAIGSDFDGADMDSRLRSTADIPELYFKLSEKGVSDRVLNKIFYENAYSYMGNL